jgi:hypothetical protein
VQNGRKTNMKTRHREQLVGVLARSERFSHSEAGRARTRGSLAARRTSSGATGSSRGHALQDLSSASFGWTYCCCWFGIFAQARCISKGPGLVCYRTDS